MRLADALGTVSVARSSESDAVKNAVQEELRRSHSELEALSLRSLARVNQIRRVRVVDFVPARGHRTTQP
jgi:hypothetical protein